MRWNMAQHFTAAHWHERAEEARTLAAEMADEKSRQGMLEVAGNYDKLAAYAEKMER